MIGVYIVRGVQLRNSVSNREYGDQADMWMIWPTVEERDELIALLQGKPYPPTRDGSR